MKTSLSDALQRADRFFMGKSELHAAAKRLTEALEGLGIPFAFAGAWAVNAHGHRRETEDLDILLTRAGLEAFKQHWLGRGWVEKFPGSKGLRDAVCDVKVDVLLEGEYPGDGKPKPVRFPDPAVTPKERDPQGVPVIALPVLLELKIASGMTAAHRPRDLDDAIQLIKKSRLPLEYADTLAPYVREKFRELWQAAQIDEDY